MHDGDKSTRLATLAPATRSVEELASRALSIVLSDNRSKQPLLQRSYEEIIAALGEAVLDEDPDQRRRVVSELLDGGVAPGDFIATYTRDTAALLGDMWAQNQISFVEVTIGASRLQETVRALRGRRTSRPDPSEGPGVLMVIPQAEGHILGGLIAAEMFEQRGCAVQLALGLKDADIAAMVSAGSFDMIAVSVNSTRVIEPARRLITALRRATRNSSPIVLGGWITQNSDIAETLGSDFTTSDPDLALRLCGLGTAPAIEARSEISRQGNMGIIE